MSHNVSFAEGLRTWARIAALSFGGPAGQIAVMHRILVDEKKWIGEERFLHALNYCMLLPGPEAQQLATYLGWLMHKTRGGIAAGVLFILPGFVSILALSLIYTVYGGTTPVQGLFFGLKAAVLAIVIQAVIRIARRALKAPAMVVIAGLAFLGIWLFRLPFPLIIAAAALAGLAGGLAGWAAFKPGGGHAKAKNALADRDSALGEDLPDHARPNLAWSARISIVLLVLWLGPVAALWLTLGPDHVFTALATFFSKLAVLTFGGAYAVLAWVAQAAVDQFHWVTPGEMLDGLGMAETTPGPLIMVLQFVGFLAAWRAETGLPPWLAATLASILVTWVTFVPCFLWIFLGAPWIERLRQNRALAGALTAITAAVVGVILNLALWFGLHVLFARVASVELGPAVLDLPDLASLSLPALVLVVLALLAIFWRGWSAFLTLALSAALGIAWVAFA